MIVTETERELVTALFFNIQPATERMSALFYTRLFEVDPSAKDLFADIDMNQMGFKLMQTLGAAVSALADPEPFLFNEKGRALGQRHLAYGVRKEQYPLVGQALLWAFEQQLGDDFTAMMRIAWVKVFNALANLAMEAYDK